VDATVARPADPSDETSRLAVLPELRDAWWETGLRRRAEAPVAGVFAELPRLAKQAVAVAWKADRSRTLVVAVATIVSGVLGTFGLLSTQQVLIELFGSGPTPDRVQAALPALTVLAAVTVLRGALTTSVGYAQEGLAPQVTQASERRLFETTTAVRLDAFDADAFADDMERATTGTESAVDLVESTMNLFAGVVSLLAVTAAVIVISPVLLLALLVATLPKGWAALSAGHQHYQSYLAGSVRRRRMWILRGLMADRRSAAELRSYGLRGFLLDQYDRVMAVETKIEIDLARKVSTITGVGAVIGGIATGAVYVLLGVLLHAGEIPLAAAATCVIAVQAAQRALTTVTLFVDRLYTEGQHFGDYTGFMARAEQYLPPPAPASPRPAETFRELSVRRVSLLYPERERPAVDEVSLTVRAGETVAFVGENGSGKSTLAGLIAGLRTPSGGAVHWNGRPLAEWDQPGLRARIAVVTQDYNQWPFTAATNIAIGDTEAEPEQARIEAAAARAVADEVIRELPHGYETLLDRRFANGQDLSGGQWQRITAARGFLRDAELLIMDEPSSALDPRAEDALFQAIRDRQGRVTTILITHRLANIRHADRIFVLHEGVLEETGRHDELIAAGGRYAELFTLQASGYAALQKQDQGTGRRIE
jgi:ATP-binding cassette subfamily B protein